MNAPQKSTPRTRPTPQAIPLQELCKKFVKTYIDPWPDDVHPWSEPVVGHNHILGTIRTRARLSLHDDAQSPLLTYEGNIWITAGTDYRIRLGNQPNAPEMRFVNIVSAQYWDHSDEYIEQGVMLVTNSRQSIILQNIRDHRRRTDKSPQLEFYQHIER